MKDNTNALMAIVAVTTIAIMAMYKQLDGNLMMACVVAIAGLGGYELYKRDKEAEKKVIA
jgi:hypothetical protein